MKDRPTLEEFVMAHRYRYYVLAQPSIPDHVYDVLEAQARKILPNNSPVHGVGSDSELSYSPEVIWLAKQLAK